MTPVAQRRFSNSEGFAQLADSPIVRLDVGRTVILDGDITVDDFKLTNVEQIKANGNVINGTDSGGGDGGANTINLSNVKQVDGGGPLTINAGGGNDTVKLSGFSFANGADVLAAATQVGSDVVINLEGQTLTLQNTNLSSLHANDFKIVT